MNDSKWHKLIESLTDNLEEIYLNYKLIDDDSIYFTSLAAPDFKLFFKEPIFYKEVEWIEFPKVFNLEHNKRTSRKYITKQNQDIDSIGGSLKQLGNS